MKSTVIKQKDLTEKWYLVDVADMRIGKAASLIAQLLQGKNNPKTRDYLTPSTKVVAINCSKLDFTPKRGFSKFYKSYSGFPGGLKYKSLEETFETNKTFPLENAVRGMLPKTKQGRKMIVNFKAYENDSHSHEAQKPEAIDLNTYKL